MESKKAEVKVEKGSAWRRPVKLGKEYIPGYVERCEERRAAIIDTEVSIRENIERRLSNYLYY